MIHGLSALIQARQKGVGLEGGTFGSKGPNPAPGGPPKTARDVLGATDGVRKAEDTAREHRSEG